MNSRGLTAAQKQTSRERTVKRTIYWEGSRDSDAHKGDRHLGHGQHDHDGVGTGRRGAVHKDCASNPYHGGDDAQAQTSGDQDFLGKGFGQSPDEHPRQKREEDVHHDGDHYFMPDGLPP